MSLLAIYCYLPQCSADRSTPPTPVPPDTGTFACHSGSALSSNWPVLCCSSQERGDMWHHFAPQVSHLHLHGASLVYCWFSRSWSWNDVFFKRNMVQGRGKRAWRKVPLIPFVFKCGVKHCGRSLMQHGECISTAVRVMDRGAMLLPAHNRPAGWGA